MKDGLVAGGEMQPPVANGHNIGVGTLSDFTGLGDEDRVEETLLPGLHVGQHVGQERRRLDKALGPAGLRCGHDRHAVFAVLLRQFRQRSKRHDHVRFESGWWPVGARSDTAGDLDVDDHILIPAAPDAVGDDGL